MIIPLYKNQDNVPALFDVLGKMMGKQVFEVVFVDDGSPDKSREYALAALENTNWPWKLVSHARNFGSFEAIRTGFSNASGENLAFMAADLQEPPELILNIFTELENESSDIVIGRRVFREDGFADRVLSTVFWKLYRIFINPAIPEGGVDVFGCTREVAKTLLMFRETRSSLLAQLFWIGYRRTFMDYTRQERRAGKSAWTFRKKISYMSDSIFAFSDLPLRLLTWLGVFGLSCTLITATATLIARLSGQIQTPGYTTLILVITGSTALVLIGLGIVGGYVWRAYENTKGRPLSITSFVKSSNNND